MKTWLLIVVSWQESQINRRHVKKVCSRESVKRTRGWKKSWAELAKCPCRRLHKEKCFGLHFRDENEYTFDNKWVSLHGDYEGRKELHRLTIYRVAKSNLCIGGFRKPSTYSLNDSWTNFFPIQKWSLINDPRFFRAITDK